MAQTVILGEFLNAVEKDTLEETRENARQLVDTINDFITQQIKESRKSGTTVKLVKLTQSIQMLFAYIERHEIAVTKVYSEDRSTLLHVNLDKTEEEIIEDRKRRQECVLMDAEQDIETTQKQLASSIRSAIFWLQGGLEDLENGHQPNSLGILQGNGVEIDRLCGVLNTKKEALAQLKRALR